MLDSKSIAKILREARTHNGFQDKPVTDAQVRDLYDLLKWGPTSSNSQPARFVFVRTNEGKEKLRPALSSGNTAKTMEAPVTVIVAYDTRFYEHLPRTFPHNPAASSWFTGPGNEQVAFHTAFRHGSGSSEISATSPKPRITAPEIRFSHSRPRPVKCWRSATAVVHRIAHQPSAPQNTAVTSTVASGRLPPTPARLRPAKAAPKAMMVSGLNTVMKKLDVAK